MSCLHATALQDVLVNSDRLGAATIDNGGGFPPPTMDASPGLVGRGLPSLNLWATTSMSIDCVTDSPRHGTHR